jgi:urate oxidase
VISKKVKTDSSQKFIDVCQQLVPSDTTEDHIKAVCTTFVRKYTHARVGGHIKGRQERNAEKRGVRAKGGCSLRDKLYNLSSGTKGAKSQSKLKNSQPKKNKTK